MSRLAAFVVLAGAAAGAFPPSAFAFVKLGVKWPGGTVGYRVNPNFPDPTLSGTPDRQIEFIQCAAKAWRDQSRAAWGFVYQGTTTLHAFDERDGVNIVAWTDADGGDALAATLISGDNGVARSFDTLFFNSSSGNPNPWSGPGEPGPGEFDITGVATHELGHALGLDHSPLTQATMFASASGRALGLRTLDADDRSGVESIYGLRTQLPPAVQITSVSPEGGPTTGGNQVVLEGVNFTYDSETQLFIGGAAVSGSSFDTETCGRLRITRMPAGPLGPVSIRLVNSIGSVTLDGAYRYGALPPRVLSIDPAEGPTAGGIPVEVTGENFAPGAVASIGGSPLGDQEVLSATAIRGTLPPHPAPGPVDVTLEQGADRAVLPGAFTYNPYFLRIAKVEAAPGQTAVSVDVRASSPDPLAAISFGVAYDRSLVTVTGVSRAGTPAEAADFFNVKNLSAGGVVTVSILMDVSGGSKTFPAGADVPAARIIADLAPTAAVGTSSPLGLESLVGQPPVELLFRRSGSQESLHPLTEDGAIAVVRGLIFLRGDANGDGRRDISDPIFVLDFLFRGGGSGRCDDAADANDDGAIDISDAITLLDHLFGGGPALPEPFEGPGIDPTPDGLGCKG